MYDRQTCHNMANVDWQATYYLMRESLINHAKTSFNDVAIFDWPKIISYSAAGRYRMADLFKPVAMAGVTQTSTTIQSARPVARVYRPINGHHDAQSQTPRLS
ncbi:protein of unknown function [Lactiplantibacillus plantarum]